MATTYLEKEQPNADPNHVAASTLAEQEKKRDSSGYAHDDDATVVVVDDGKTTIPKGTYDPVYEAKARVLNDAIQDIGMGWYQWQLFIVVGFGWASDNMWPITTSLILPAIVKEYPTKYPPMLTLAQNIGLLAGALFWGFGCDIFGRRQAFNLTLGVTAVWGLIAAGSPSFAAAGVFAAFWSFGVGGNLPVDSAVFLEFLPGSHQYLLTVLSLDWALAQVIANLIAWPLLGHKTCSSDEATAGTCTRSKNFGWRYFVIAMGGITLLMFVTRFLFFTIYESPKYLMGKGKDEEAVQIVHEVARRNGKTSNLTLDDLKACEPPNYVAPTSAADTLKRELQNVNLDHVKEVFKTKKLAYSTTLIILVWALIGLGYPLYNAFLPSIMSSKSFSGEQVSVARTYRDTLIIATMGVPGALVGALFSEIPGIGRKGILSASCILTGVFLYVSTVANSSNAFLGYNCAYNFFSSIMYAVLYAYTPELFSTANRGTGNALTASANRIFGIMAPLIMAFGNRDSSVPVYISGALFIVGGLLVILMPFESRGKAAL
ncbi:hypothetical protein VHUM_03159 [Vanrija humicola]|uniref:Major facilitator superfamily (MFS) profile domain-containing protein n=1 Tax=Vanrija humicola TaxID=5417 RepID=A0A7D8YX29_VANHU|nr:hypothetical protein VHUM_03159 [Vanrija humicola]